MLVIFIVTCAKIREVGMAAHIIYLIEKDYTKFGTNNVETVC